MTPAKLFVFFGFKNGKLTSIVQSIEPDVKSAVDCHYFVADPQEAEKQIKTWEKQAKLYAVDNGFLRLTT
jgi:hypothetical protein